MSPDNRSILEAALRGLEARRERIDQHITTVRRMMRGGTGRGPGRPAGAKAEAEASARPARKKRRFSAAVRKRLAEAMRQRWAVKRTAAQAAASKSKKKTAVKSSRVFGRKTLNAAAPQKGPAEKKQPLPA
ncbi:MAG TPA: hypothetical protein VFL57_05645 [Bryobacteraceae bacterium]|nr:hypothetical protein [Bryobacteraceae bacterium]